MTAVIENAFDFILLKLAKVFVEKKYKMQFDSWEDIIAAFNKGNNFDQSKINLYPFLITMGNGHKEQLLKIFGKDFIYTSIGIFNGIFYVVSRRGSTSNLKWMFDNDSLEIIMNKNLIEKYHNRTDLIENLIDIIAENGKIDKEVLGYINKSIDSIDKKYQDSFVLGSHIELLHLNRMHTSFIKLENAIRSIKDRNNNQDYIRRIKELQDGFNNKIKFERSSLEFA